MARRGDNGRTEERKEKKTFTAEANGFKLESEHKLRLWFLECSQKGWGYSLWLSAATHQAGSWQLRAKATLSATSRRFFFFFHELIRAWMDGEMLGDDLSKNYLHALAHSVRASQKSHWASCLSWSLTLTLGTNSWPLMSGQILQRPACSLRVN